MKLNALTRLCIVLYTLGVTVGPLYVLNNSINGAHEAARKWNELCLELAKSNPDARAKCWKENAEVWRPEAWPILLEAFVAFAIVNAIVWLLCFTATRTIRWILAGREN